MVKIVDGFIGIRYFSCLLVMEDLIKNYVVIGDKIVISGVDIWYFMGGVVYIFKLVDDVVIIFKICEGVVIGSKIEDKFIEFYYI